MAAEAGADSWWRPEWARLQSGSEQHRQDFLEDMALNARLAEQPRSKLRQCLSSPQHQALLELLPVQPVSEVLQLLLEFSPVFTEAERVLVMRTCLSTEISLAPVDVPVFDDPAWTEAQQCARILEHVDYLAHSALDFGRSPSSFSTQYDPALSLPYRRLVVRRLCTKPGRCQAEMWEGLQLSEPKLDDELWSVVIKHNELRGILPEDASDRLRQLAGQQWLRSQDMTEAVRSIKRYRLDPLQVDRANEDLVAALGFLKELWSKSPA